MNEFYEKMKADIERNAQSLVKGLSSRDIVATNYSEAELLELADKLKQLPVSANDAFRLSAFIFERQSQRIPEPIRRMAADNVASHVRTGSKDMDAAAAEIFVNWGIHRSDYRIICLSLLRHPGVEIREATLKCAGKFLHPSEFSHLFIFREDSYIAEISMGGPLRYVLRDYALDILKWLTKCSVQEDDCFHETPGGRVSYRSWSPFLNWFEEHKRQLKQFQHGNDWP
jgi:hypothetical protein